jgi:hypothetical protein
VHSLALNEVEIRRDAVAIVGADGTIEDIVDVAEGLDLQQLVQGMEVRSPTCCKFNSLRPLSI